MSIKTLPTINKACRNSLNNKISTTNKHASYGKVEQRNTTSSPPNAKTHACNQPKNSMTNTLTILQPNLYRTRNTLSCIDVITQAKNSKSS